MLKPTGQKPILVRIALSAFCIGVVIPLIIYLGDLRLTVYRIVLILTFLPTFFLLLSRGITAVDFVVLGICVWTTIAQSVVEGFNNSTEIIGIFWVETLGAWLLGRTLVRDRIAFLFVIKVVAYIAIVTFPFAIHEFLTGEHLLIEMVSKVGETYQKINMEQRLGFSRVQGPFAHPIHMGVFFGSVFGLIVLGLGKRRGAYFQWLRGVLVSFLNLCSLSSGPLMGLSVQVYLVLWDGLMRNVKYRWQILMGIFAVIYVTISLLSNRTPFHVLASYLAFNSNTAYDRIRIWTWGTKSIWNNPVFGIGINGDWERLWHMSASVDMFWIIEGMRHGVIAWILWFILFFNVFFGVASSKIFDPQISNLRKGFLISLLGFFVSGWAVHFWDAIYVWFVFLMASGVWFWEKNDSESKVETLENGTNLVQPIPRYSRY